MKQNLITDVVQGMLPYLNNAQTEKLQEVLQHTLFGYEVTKVENDTENLEQDLVELFLSAKRIEGCSEKTLKYYNATIQAMLACVGKGVRHIVTDDVRSYLTEYQAKNQSSKVTIDNIMLMYGKEASNRKQEIDRQHYTIPNQRPKDKHCGKI